MQEFQPHCKIPFCVMRIGERNVLAFERMATHTEQGTSHSNDRNADGNKVPKNIDHAEHASIARVPGDIGWHLRLLPSIMGLSVFGGSITFSILVAKREGSNGRFTDATINTFLAIAWLFFAIALVISWGGQQTLTEFSALQEEENKKWREIFLSLLSLALQLLVSDSLLFLSLVVVCYIKPVGWVSVGFMSLFIVILCIVWVWSACVWFVKNFR